MRDLEARRAYNRAWNAAHRDAIRKAGREWDARNRDRRRAQNLARYQADPLRARLRIARQKATRLGVPVFRLSRRDEQRLRGPCAYCGAPSTDLDHVIPFVRGGRHSIGNLVPACGPCNGRKARKLLVEWRGRSAQKESHA